MGDKAHMTECDYVGLVSANNEQDKMKKAGFTTMKSEFVDASVINELPVADESVLSEEGNITLTKFFRFHMMRQSMVIMHLVSA